MKSVDKIIEKVPITEIYEDGLKPTVESSGEVIALIPRTIKALLQPLEKWVLNREYSIKEITKLLEEKLKDTPPDNIVSPEPYIAVPALQAISYSFDSSEIRNLYANLLATSMKKTSKFKVHPSFVEIIKQINPDEAKIIQHIYNKSQLPIINITFKTSKEKGEKVIRRHYSSIDKILGLEHKENIPKYIDNLDRLKIIDLTYQQWYTNDNLYKEIVSDAKNRFKISKDYTFKPVKGTSELSDFGKGFCEVCLDSNNP
jgi:hypothetical protein